MTKNRSSSREIGALIKKIREDAGYRTQAQLAEAIRQVSSAHAGGTVRPRGYSRSAIAALEAGSQIPTDDFVHALAVAVPGCEDQLRAAIEKATNSTNALQRAPSQVVTALLNELEVLRQQGNDRAILRYRETFSRFLFLEGENEARTRLGRYAEEAAARLSDREAQAAALIDDLGWSLFVLKSHEEAELNIKHGLDVAEANSLPFLQCKAYRHLAGMALEEHDLESADKFVQKARSIAEAIQDQSERSQMLAGIEYAAALIAFYSSQYEVAQEALARSETLRQVAGDYSRMVKVHAMFGKIFEKQGKIGLAYDSYRAGLEEARAVGRKDEQIRNLFGLSRVLRSMGRPDEAAASEKTAQEMGESLPLTFEELSSPEL